MTRHILHVDLDEFFVSVERTFDPNLKGKPVVVGGKRNSRGVVSCASYEAREYGLRAGMPLASAARLCPEAVFISGNYHQYREASKGFLDIISEFTPEIEKLGLEESYLDLTGFEPIYGPVRETALKIKERVKSELGLIASVGIAGSKVVAKVASGMSKPDGLIEVPAGTERIFLAPLPVDKLPCIGPKTHGVLAGLGITTIGELGNLPLAILRQTFGVHGEIMYSYANGIDDRKVESRSAARSISRERTFCSDTWDSNYISAALYYLSERVGAQLRSQGRLAKCVTLKLRFADFESITRSRSMSRAVETDSSIFEAGYGLLDKALDNTKKAVRLVGIGVSGLVDGRQPDMFDTRAETRGRVNEAVDHIRDRYGFKAIEVGRTLSLKQPSQG